MERAIKTCALAFALVSALSSCKTWDFSLETAMKTPFHESIIPPEPDYGDTTSWAALPTMQDNADLVPHKKFKNRQDSAQVDVFYIHPTTIWKTDSIWNAAIDAVDPKKRIDELVIKFHGSVFNGSCKVYAPRYRQANARSFRRLQNGGMQALGLAYSDVRRAFLYYLKNHNNGRPMIIAGHSQGSAHAMLLLKEFFDGKPLTTQLVAAYPIGFPIPKDSIQHLPTCDMPDQTGCYTTFATFEEGFRSAVHESFTNMACVNPLNWKRNPENCSRKMHLGIVDQKFNFVFEKSLSARIHEDVLWIKRKNLFIKMFYNPKNYHLADYNLFWGNIRQNVKVRVDAYLNHQRQTTGSL